MSEVGHRRFLAGAGAAVAVSASGVLADTAEADQQSVGMQATTVKPDDAQYIDIIWGTNQRWVGNPDVVRVRNSADQVVAAIQDTVTTGKRIGVRSGGHCYENFVYEATQVVIDVSELDAIGYDPAHNAILVGVVRGAHRTPLAAYLACVITVCTHRCGSRGYSLFFSFYVGLESASLIQFIPTPC